MAQKQVVLLIHGFPVDGRMWKDQVEALGSDFQVIAPDLDGHGASPAGSPARSMDEIARSLAARLDAADVGAVHVGGFSMGGYVALAFIRLFPGRVLSLVLVDTRASADDEAGREGRDKMIAAIQQDGPSAAAQAMLPRMFTENVDAATLKEAEEWMLAQPAEALIADLTAMRARPDSTPMLGDIHVPTLVLVGDQDTIAPPDAAQALASAIRGARLVVITGAAHLAPLEQPAQVNAALREFLG